MKTDFFQKTAEADDIPEDKKHPEGIEQQKNNGDDAIDGLGQEQSFDQIILRNGAAHIDETKIIDETPHKDRNQKDFKKQNIKMAHHPLRRAVVPVAHLGHEIVQAHTNLLSKRFYVISSQTQ